MPIRAVSRPIGGGKWGSQKEETKELGKQGSFHGFRIAEKGGLFKGNAKTSIAPRTLMP